MGVPPRSKGLVSVQLDMALVKDGCQTLEDCFASFASASKVYSRRWGAFWSLGQGGAGYDEDPFVDMKSYI